MSLRKDSFAWVGVGAAVALVLVVAAFFVWSFVSTPKVQLGTGSFKVRLAMTDDQRAKGLGGVSKLDDSEGMLFVYEKDQLIRIWMKDMKIPIDVAWLDSERKVIHVEKSLQPDSYPEAYGPYAPARYVVELAEGAIDRHTIRVGTIASFSDPGGRLPS